MLLSSINSYLKLYNHYVNEVNYMISENSDVMEFVYMQALSMYRRFMIDFWDLGVVYLQYVIYSWYNFITRMW